STIAPTPVPLSDNAAAVYQGKVYTVGAGSGTGEARAAFVYDPTSDAWGALPDMPRKRSQPEAAFIRNQLYVFGGWDATGTPIAAVDVLDPVSETWTTLPVTNPKPRAAAGIAVVGSKAYLVGGCTDSSCTTSNDVVGFDPSTWTFSAQPAYPHNVAFTSCGGIDGVVYCAGGADLVGFSDGFAFDPTSTGWNAIANLPLDLWGSAVSAANGLL